jgi:osomolarity two-component system response regulator SKN7
MEQSAQYSPMHSRHHLFQSSQLPPPSQLHLPVPSSYSRSNTLPPITHIPPAQQNHSFPYHSAVLPSLPPSPTSQHPWQTQHRTSSSRDEFYPPQQPNLPRSDPARSSTVIVKDEANPSLRPYPVHHEPQPPAQHLPLPAKEPTAVEDGMPSTSDFVKKLYKCALPFRQW